MADDLDKFVLQYQVDLKDSISRLEKLQEKMNGVQKKSKDSAKALKGFASDASDELGKLVPGVNAVSAAVKVMGAEFAAAAAAIGALAIGVKMVMNLRDQYNAQRSEGMQLGVSSIRMEEYTRKFAKGSGGYVSRDQAVEGIKAFSGMANSAYADPSRLGREARLMRMLGVDVGQRGMAPTGLNDQLTQLATGLQGKSKNDVQGIAKVMGVSQDWLMTVQKLGSSIGKVTEMTGDEIDKRKDAEANLGKFNDQLATLKEKFTELSNVLAEPLLPAMTRLVELMQKVAEAIPPALKDTKNAVAGGTGAMTGIDVTGKGFWGKFNPGGGIIGALTGGVFGKKTAHSGLGILGELVDMFSAPSNAAESRTQEKSKADAKKAADKRDDAVDKMDAANKQGIQTANQMQLAVNMFAGAVQSFSSAINIQQAWAAWAGEIGKANNLPGSSGAASSVSQVGPTSYDDFFQASAKKYGVSVDLIKRIAQVESTMNPNAKSDQGAIGLMQVLQSNAPGVNLRDPQSNIDQGTKLFADYLKRSGGDVNTALMMYHGGLDRSGWGPKTQAYPGKVLGAAGGGIGESKAKMNIQSVQQAVADYLHVPLNQIQRGAVTKGDAGWALSQMDAGLQNHIWDIKKQLAVAGMPQQNYAKLQMELRDQSRGLDMLRQYGDQVKQGQKEGGQSRTIGEMPIIINVNGAADPKAVASEVNNQLTQALKDLVNHYATPLKS